MYYGHMAMDGSLLDLNGQLAPLLLVLLLIVLLPLLLTAVNSY